MPTDNPRQAGGGRFDLERALEKVLLAITDLQQELIVQLQEARHSSAIGRRRQPKAQVVKRKAAKGR